MEAIALIFSKFSEELIAAQLAVLLFVAGSAVYYLLVKKKKKESAEWVPAAIVRAYLDRVQAEEREVRMKLFGEVSPTYTVSSGAAAPLAAALGTPVSDPNLMRELEALRAQLSLSDQRAIEFDRNMNAIKAEKAALEQKLKDLSAGAPVVAAGAGSAEYVALQKEAQDLKDKLQEYSVIEDDLANLKKFQKENEQLRQRVSQLETGAPANTTISGSPAAPQTTTVVSGSGDNKGAAGIVLVSGASQAAAPAATVIPAAAAAPVATATVAAAPDAAPQAAAPAAPETNTNVLAPVTPAVDAGAPAAPAAEKSSKQKEEELLSEFEKMLAS